MLNLILHSLLTLTLCTAAFIGGVKLADRYHALEKSAVDYALERQRADLRANVTPLSPATPYISPLGKHAAR